MTNENKKLTAREKAALKVEEEKVTKQKDESIEDVKEVKEPEKPSKTRERKKKIEIDRNEMIACRSTTDGRLVYLSPRTREQYIWAKYGAIQFIDMGELLSMQASSPGFLHNVRFVIDDDEAAEYLGLNKFYETVFQVEDLGKFLKKSYSELEEALPKLPEGLRDSVASKARVMVEDGTLDSRRTIQLIEKILKVELLLFEK